MTTPASPASHGPYKKPETPTARKETPISSMGPTCQVNLSSTTASAASMAAPVMLEMRRTSRAEARMRAKNG